jgi:hypothetical protein
MFFCIMHIHVHVVQCKVTVYTAHCTVYYSKNIFGCNTVYDEWLQNILLTSSLNIIKYLLTFSIDFNKFNFVLVNVVNICTSILVLYLMLSEEIF